MQQNMRTCLITQGFADASLITLITLIKNSTWHWMDLFPNNATSLTFVQILVKFVPVFN
jgi:hypothetical protein